jgi:ribonucleotide reductase alpha subunit
MMKVSFEDPRALIINDLIHETIYHAAMETSMEIAKVEGPYTTFPGSPLSQGKF